MLRWATSVRVSLCILEHAYDHDSQPIRATSCTVHRLRQCTLEIPQQVRKAPRNKKPTRELTPHGPVPLKRVFKRAYVQQSDAEDEPTERTYRLEYPQVCSQLCFPAVRGNQQRRPAGQTRDSKASSAGEERTEEQETNQETDAARSGSFPSKRVKRTYTQDSDQDDEAVHPNERTCDLKCPLARFTTVTPSRSRPSSGSGRDRGF
jgi:hypothetical protein